MPLPDNITIRGITHVIVHIGVIGKDPQGPAEHQFVQIPIDGSCSLRELGEAVQRGAFNALKIAVEKACKVE
jgi:hypothetical protein